MQGISIKSRCTLIDIAKYLSAILVVWSHILSENSDMVRATNQLCMPTFFAISGFFLFSELRSRPFSVFVRQKISRLLVPYCIWSLVAFSFHVILIIFGNASMTSLKREGIDIFLHARSVWFAVVLFINLILLGILYHLSTKLHISEIPVFFVSYLVCVLFGLNTLFSLYKLKEFFLFSVIGYTYASYMNANEESENKDYTRYLLLSLPLFIAYQLLVTGLVNPFHQNILSSGRINTPVIIDCLLWISGGVLGFLSIIGLSALFDSRSKKMMLAHAGTYSMDIYVIHMFLIEIMKPIIPKWIQGKLWLYGSFFYAIVVTIVIILICKFVLRNIYLYRVSIGIETISIKK